MDFFEVVNARRSIRKYKETPIPRETIDKILNAGILAPSWNNRQCWRYILISDPKMREMLAMLVDVPLRECFITAPYALVLCADSSDSGHQSGKDYYLVDCGMCLSHIVLAAAAEGIGTCLVGLFPENPVRNLLGIPQDIRVVALTPLGIPDEKPESQERKDFSDIVFEEKWTTHENLDA